MCVFSLFYSPLDNKIQSAIMKYICIIGQSYIKAVFLIIYTFPSYTTLIKEAGNTMKITRVEVYAFNCNTKMSFNPIGCRIYTSDGIYGDGEAALSYGVGAPAAFGMVQDLSLIHISSASKGVPSWNITPSRRCMVKVFAS